MVKPQTERQRRWREGLYAARDRVADLEAALQRIEDETKIPASGYSHYRIKQIIADVRKDTPEPKRFVGEAYGIRVYADPTTSIDHIWLHDGEGALVGRVKVKAD